MIAISGENIVTTICPQVKLEVSYTRPDLNRRNEYKRTVTYSGNRSQNISVNKRGWGRIILHLTWIKSQEADVGIANYLDGHQVAKFDELKYFSE